MIRNVGELNRLIRITRTVASGEPILVAKCMAAIRGMSGKEYAASGGTAAEAVTTFTIRFRRGVQAGQRIERNDEIYEITYVNPIQNGRYLEMKARSVKGVVS